MAALLKNTQTTFIPEKNTLLGLLPFSGSATRLDSPPSKYDCLRPLYPFTSSSLILREPPGRAVFAQ